MTYRLILSPGVHADIRSAIYWYGREDVGLSFRFLAATRATFRRMVQYPRAFQILRGSIRRALVRKFPYAVYFQIKGDEVIVQAILHQRRSEIVWFEGGNGAR